LNLMHLINLGLIDYREALERQHRIHEKVVAGELPAALIVCRHRPVITVGRAAKAAGLLLPETEYANRGIEVIKVDRGGDITYHGPGQITAYPIYPLSAFAYDLHAYLRFLEDSVISMLGEIGIISSRLRGLRGVWVSNRKIASIGIAVKNGFHTMAFHLSSGAVKWKILALFGPVA